MASPSAPPHRRSRFIAASTQPDHDSVATFRRRFLVQIEALFVQGYFVFPASSHQDARTPPKGWRSLLVLLVGGAGFEPATSTV
jgi:hypothetical protein